MSGTPLPVTCGIIERDGKVLCTRSSARMSLPLKWEFPGGKIDEGESPEDCLRRELREELGIEAEIGRSLPPVTYAYPELSVTLYPFLCRIAPDASITLHEHDRAAWLDPGELPSLDWAEADVAVVDAYRQAIQGLLRSCDGETGGRAGVECRKDVLGPHHVPGMPRCSGFGATAPRSPLRPRLSRG